MKNDQPYSDFTNLQITVMELEGNS